MDAPSDHTRLRFSEANQDQPARVAVVAEIGVNHDGDESVARRLIDAAAGARIDAVKFQYFHPDRLLSEQALLAGYQKGKAASQKELLGKLALSLDVLGRLVEHVHDRGLAAIVTPFSLEDPADLAPLGLDAIKTASPDAVNTPLLEACAALGLPMLISTGTCDLDELRPAADLLGKHAAGGALLHCVSSYPTPDEQAQLFGMQALADAFGLPVGYSDHTTSMGTGGLAVAAGAVVIEKHLTHDADADGPDHAVSLIPGQMRAYTENIRLIEKTLGARAKRVSAIESDVRQVSRQSVCTVRDLAEGHVLAAGDLTVKRPGTGIPAAQLANMIGRTLNRSVAANHLLTPEDLSPAD